jgi:hypothetical protein
MPSNALKDDDHAGPRCATPASPANNHRRLACAFRTRLARGARPPRECSPKAMTRPSSTGSDAIAAGCPARPVEESGGILGPDPQTNEMQGHGISFCGHCGRSLTPQITRRGHPKRYCSDACRARAWRQCAGRHRHRGLFEDSQDVSPELTGDRYAGDKTPDSVTAGEEVALS